MEKSLSEVHGTIETAKQGGVWKKILAFFGPAYLVSVGYMDPGNWATDLAGGSAYGYKLIWVLLMSNIIALLLQSFSARLGLVSGRDLAQANRESYPRAVNLSLYVLAEIAIAACDLAEVLGMAIGLKLLFHLPILWGVAITILDTFLLLFLQRLGMRKMEVFIISLITIIGLSFFAELLFAHPNPSEIIVGFIPGIPDEKALYIAIGIIGATVMPHNLYLHSALVQTRIVSRNEKDLRQAIKYNFWDSAIALNIAFLVNASILILGAAAFFKNGYTNIADIEDAHKLLAPLLGTLAPILFAVALIASGQSSTITGTLAGQIIMEGYLNIRLPMWLRRAITRLLAVIPAFFAVLYFGESATGRLLILSQVILSLQLAFAIIPLIHFVSDKKRMGIFVVNKKWQIVAWFFSAIIIVFNIKLVFDTLGDWFANGNPNPYLKFLVILLTVFVAGLLVYVTIHPYIKGMGTKKIKTPHAGVQELGVLGNPIYKRIAITVDFSSYDVKAIEHATSQGNKSADYLLIHIVETPNAILMEEEGGDMESKSDTSFLKKYVEMLSLQGFNATFEVGYGRRGKLIPEIINANKSDLVVMAAHGHTGLSDMLFGETINTVRHRIDVPLLVVK
ncbi:MAG: Nramp family divalent metal transporter [Bacteroidetes bacterium]|nr:Nramp family divalent metal transporter [Bacteroidota bacterium]